ncbi:MULTISPECIES: RNA-binding S4 domain-containing protein [unclassified Paracoccus (in: a-proteobacteria)]|uniref:RNA-binding S4 domain-containing protein n=1 Tax=unclassified Paracoccus (in: a-proteobacteria) TaxID=2688777 RepID=UPI0013548F9E|nr:MULTISPECIES: RNA-binding S4 domain-containing protein [unclassified Paracoccus (in: a-proteobacteria)]UXU74450.1 RNA-binding S4 domain-containing protein [Paracoccus sp. SMMA_5]UXU80341.1 RNA-binding S4 domain-containing protein [Paracoccus sp. SMMA_5_TC]
MSDPHTSAASGAIRLDRWLHHARLFRTRTIAADAISEGGIRVNGQPCSKPSHLVRTGDTITVAAHGRVRVLRLLLTGARRGSASEAAMLYEELAL